jgi:hypothetical protein
LSDPIPKWARDDYGDPYEFERETARRYNGRREIASGAFSGELDVNSEDLTIDNKQTNAKQFTVKVADFMNIVRVAAQKGTTPMFLINMKNPGINLVVLRQSDFDAYYEASRLLSEMLSKEGNGEQ